MSSQRFFVYGTLKRGQCREGCWPAAPLSVCEAAVRGSLLCLGAYPGLIPGDQWVRGELWEIAQQDVEATLRVLDQIEGYQAGRQRNLYERRSVEVFLIGPGDTISPDAIAYSYWLCDPAAIRSGQIVRKPSGQAFVEGPEGEGPGEAATS